MNNHPETNPNHNAFPFEVEQIHQIGEKVKTIFPGLTKREYFATCALQGLISACNSDQYKDLIAESAVKYADALIAALNQGKR
jgi:hypothetical protein